MTELCEGTKGFLDSEARLNVPSLSLVMPLLNAQPFLKTALDSLEAQTGVDLELIVVDGGSTDGTRELVEASDLATVIDAPGHSQTEAINIGFSHARGEILGWLNGDDRCADGALRWVVEWFDNNPDAVFLYGDSMAINQSGREYGLRSNVVQGQYDQLVHKDFIVQPSAFWRREIFEKYGPLDESLHYTFDYSFFLEIARENEMHYEPIVMSFERLRGGAKTSQGGSKRAAEFRRVMERHGDRDVPLAFRPEVSAIWALDGFKHMTRREFEAGRSLLSEAARMARPRRFALVHFVALVLGGPRGTAEARLVSNWLRSTARKREPQWPI